MNFIVNEMNRPDATTAPGADVTTLLREGLVAGYMPFLSVSSGSMAPLLRVGDEIGVQPVALHQLRVGDVVVVSDGSQLLTHRFCGREASRVSAAFVTRGDRTLAHDRPWREEELLGRVVVRRRKEHLLWLDYGPGRWLNGRLAGLAQREERWLGSSRRRLAAGGNQPMASRLLRAFVRTWAATLTLITEFYSRKMQTFYRTYNT